MVSVYDVSHDDPPVQFDRHIAGMGLGDPMTEAEAYFDCTAFILPELDRLHRFVSIDNLLLHHLNLSCTT
jgi:hypothetical protein